MKTKTSLLPLALLIVISCKYSEQKLKSADPVPDAVVAADNPSILAAGAMPVANFPSYNPHFPPPAGFDAFELSQDYPSSFESEDYPWLAIDFRTDPKTYIQAVLNYSLEGNITVNFKGQLNDVRKWYHAPWLHDDGSNSFNKGREYIHGMTRERWTPKFEIHDNQDKELQNWAVGMYNAPGGYTLGRVWNTADGKPDLSKATFPEGTVSCKLLFTAGTVEEVPFLENTLQWQANIYPDRENGTIKVNRTMSLLQLDVAVKDSTANDIGWVFGTFIYDASKNGASVWERMVPVGLSWGDDPNITADLNKKGAFVNKELKQTYLNASLIKDPTRNYTNQAYMKYHGLGGRLNGPVDNPISSCISCHGSAGVNQEGELISMGNFRLNRADFTVAEYHKYFTNVKAGAHARTIEGKTYHTTDYSLQIAIGVRNYYQNEKLHKELVNHATKTKKDLNQLTSGDIASIKDYIEHLPHASRGE